MMMRGEGPILNTSSIINFFTELLNSTNTQDKLFLFVTHAQNIYIYTRFEQNCRISYFSEISSELIISTNHSCLLLVDKEIIELERLNVDRRLETGTLHQLDVLLVSQTCSKSTVTNTLLRRSIVHFPRRQVTRGRSFTEAIDDYCHKYMLKVICYNFK